MPKTYPFIPLKHEPVSPEESLNRSTDFYKLMNARRSCRFFTDEPVDKRVIENIIKTASTAPSGAHKQPWTFVAVSDPEIKQQIRMAAEKEEREFYEHRATEEWLKDLAPIGTDPNKPFLERPPG